MTRVALVTGGGRGIGRAISRRLAADGFAVAVNYRRDQAAAEATAAEVGGRAYQASVAERDGCTGLAEAVLADFGRVDVLVCNAGIASRGNTVVNTDPDELDRVMRTLAYGPFWLCQALLPQMRGRDRGDVVLISSVNATRVMPGGAPYMMGKVALEALGRTLALEEQPHGIRTNIVAPGLVVTDMGDRLARAVAGVAVATDLDLPLPVRAGVPAEDVAAVVGWLVSDAASYVNGQRIGVGRRRAGAVATGPARPSGQPPVVLRQRRLVVVDVGPLRLAGALGQRRRPGPLVQPGRSGTGPRPCSQISPTPSMTRPMIRCRRSTSVVPAAAVSEAADSAQSGRACAWSSGTDPAGHRAGLQEHDADERVDRRDDREQRHPAPAGELPRTRPLPEHELEQQHPGQQVGQLLGDVHAVVGHRAVHQAGEVHADHANRVEPGGRDRRGQPADHRPSQERPPGRRPPRRQRVRGQLQRRADGQQHRRDHDQQQVLDHVHPLEHVPVRLDAGAGGHDHHDQPTQEGQGPADRPAGRPPGAEQVGQPDQPHRDQHPGPGLRLAGQLPEIQRREVHTSTVARAGRPVPVRVLPLPVVQAG
jgi:3-oxoacyl-[acyl-carrier protein] reductase